MCQKLKVEKDTPNGQFFSGLSSQLTCKNMEYMERVRDPSPEKLKKKKSLKKKRKNRDPEDQANSKASFSSLKVRVLLDIAICK